MKISPLTSARSTMRVSPLAIDFGGLLEVQGDAKVLGEVIQGAERQDAERNAGIGKHAGHGANAAVAAANHHRVDLGRSCPGQGRFGQAFQAPGRSRIRVCRDVERLEARPPSRRAGHRRPCGSRCPRRRSGARPASGLAFGIGPALSSGCLDAPLDRASHAGAVCATATLKGRGQRCSCGTVPEESAFARFLDVKAAELLARPARAARRRSASRRSPPPAARRRRPR